MVIVESLFIGNFKTGDNIVHNLQVLALLYQYFSQGTPEKQAPSLQANYHFLGFDNRRRTL